MFNYYTAGESHGPQITVIINGVPAGIKMDLAFINTILAERTKGYGRGDRMKIEQDTCEIVAGVRNGESTGAPIALVIPNSDWVNWQQKIPEPFLRPRPGHADLVGAMKYRRSDIRDVIERSSARETVGRVAAGAVAQLILKLFDIIVVSHVINIGGIKIPEGSLDAETIINRKQVSEINCTCPETEAKIKALIDTCKTEGDTLGGIFQVIVSNVPRCLGSFAYPDKRLDAALAKSLMSIPAIKGVELGLGFGYAYHKGSQLHDEIFYSKQKGFFHDTNNAGGIEGGMSNGEPIVLNAVMKPIPTCKTPLRSVDIQTKEPVSAAYERSDVCAVPAASRVAEAMVSMTLVEFLVERYGGDSIPQMLSHWRSDILDFEWLSTDA